MLKHAFGVLFVCGVLSLAQAGFGQSGVSRAPDPLKAFDLATFDARGLTVRYEKSLGGELAAIKDAISAHQDAEAEQAKKVRAIQEKADKLIDHVNQIIGLSPTKEQRESQQRVFGGFLKKIGGDALFAPVGGRTVCLLTRKSIKEHMRKGGALPWFSYDAKEDSVTYNLQIDLRGGMANVRELIIPVAEQTAAKDLRQVLAHLGQVCRTGLVVGVALHELTEISMMSHRFRPAPGDPYWRWFSDGFANAVAIHVLKKHVGAEESAAFAGSYETTPFLQMKEQIDLRHWMSLGLGIDVPVESEQQLKEARYAFATYEALRVTDKYGIDVVGRILDNACKGAVNESGNLAAAIQAVTGEDMGKRLDAYQSFANEDEGIAGHAKAFNAAMDRKDYAAALPHLLRIHELRCKKEGRPDPGFYANAALVLFRMGMEQAGDKVILDHADFCKGSGATGACVAMHALFIDYALKCRNLKKAVASSDIVLAAKPDDVPALAIRMLKLADSDMERAKEIAARIVRLDGESNSSWVVAAKRVLEAKTTSTAPSADPRAGQPAPPAPAATQPTAHPARSAGSGPATQPALVKASGRPAADVAEIDRLIVQLGSDKFAEREAAVKELIEIGRPALEALKSAVSDRNPERAERARNTLKAVEENLIPPEEYKARIAAYIGPTSEDQRAASHKWIHERLGATVPYLLEMAPKVTGEQAVRLHLLMFDAWEEGILRDEQKTAFVSRSLRAGLRVDQSYWPGGSRIVVLEITGLANITPDTGHPSSKPWNFLKATWVAELDGKAVARGQTWAADATYVTLPEGLTPGKHKLKAAVELAELEGRWRFSLAADAEITVLDRGPQTAPAPAGRPLAKISGRVVDDKGKPAAKVLVTAKSSAMGQNLREAFMAKAHSDEQGRFELSVPFGDIIYQVVAGLYGMYHLSKSVQVIPSNSIPVELVLDPEQDSRTIRGSVVDADGKPLGNLPVLVVGQYDQSLQTTTDPNGQFRLATGGSLGQAVAIVGTGDLAAPLRIIMDKVWDLVLEPASTLEGVIRDQDDQTPVAGATVLIRPTFANSFRMEATTDKDGRYQLDGIPAGEYTVTATAPRHFHSVGRGELPTVTLAAGENKETNIQLHHVAILRGKVVDDANKPVAGAMVATLRHAAADYRQQYGCVTTDSDGGFTIATGQVGESLPLAAFSSDKGLATMYTKEMQPGQIADGLVLRLRGAMRVKGTVTNLQGKPIKDVVCSTEDNCSASGVTGADGKFDLGRVALSTYGTVFMRFHSPRPNWGPWTRYEVADLETAPPFYLHRQLALKPQTVAQGDVTITLTSTPLQKIFGRVVGGGGKPVAGADVYLLTGDANEGNWATTVRPRLDGPGSFEIGGSRPTVICGTRSGPDGRWTCWTVREDGAGLPTGGRHTDWTRYCVGILGSGSRNLLVRNIVVPEACNTVELQIDLEAGKSRTVTTQPAEMVITPGVGVGPITLGMSKEDVIKHLGKPDKTEGKGSGLNYISSMGLSVLVSRSKGVVSISCWTSRATYWLHGMFVKDFRGATDKGIKMGAGREEIVRAYGRADSESSESGDASLRYMDYRSQGIQFMLRYGKLAKIDVVEPDVFALIPATAFSQPAAATQPAPLTSSGPAPHEASTQPR